MKKQQRRINLERLIDKGEYPYCKKQREYIDFTGYIDGYELMNILKKGELTAEQEDLVLARENE